MRCFAVMVCLLVALSADAAPQRLPTNENAKKDKKAKKEYKALDVEDFSDEAIEALDISDMLKAFLKKWAAKQRLDIETATGKAIK